MGFVMVAGKRGFRPNFKMQTLLSFILILGKSVSQFIKHKQSSEILAVQLNISKCIDLVIAFRIFLYNGE